MEEFISSTKLIKMGMVLFYAGIFAIVKNQLYLTVISLGGEPKGSWYYNI